MKKQKNKKLGDALLLGSFSPNANISNVPENSVIPVSEMPMVLTLDQLNPNPDNPRKVRNPRYDDIKASIKARGLDTVPKVTRDPDGDDTYIFSDGGNTRYQILSELWQETGDERFFRIHCLFKPWPGRLHCVIGHLAENDMRGDLTFIEKAQGVHKARTLFEDKLSKKVTLRELSKLLDKEGFPVHYSSISKMEDALNYLYPYMPTLLENGMGRGQIESLLLLRSNAKRVGKEFLSDSGDKNLPVDVFSNVCAQLDSPELFSLDVFRDELIGELIKNCPHSLLNYDRWLFELDPKTQSKGIFDNVGINQTKNNSEDEVKDKSTTKEHHDDISLPDNEAPESKVAANVKQIKATIEDEQVDLVDVNNSSEEEKALVKENDFYSTKKNNTPNGESENEPIETLISPYFESLPSQGKESQPITLSALCPISPLQDDIEHLQVEIFRSVFSLVDRLGMSEFISQDNSEMRSSGFRINEGNTPVLTLLKLLSGHDGEVLNHGYLCEVLVGSCTTDKIKSPDFDDEAILQFIKIVRLLRRLRELQSIYLLDGVTNLNDV